jgi:hypothetical protein
MGRRCRGVRFPSWLLHSDSHHHIYSSRRFNPGRWLNLPPKYDPTTSFLSFHAGPHGCIGKEMAISVMKAVIASLIARFEFTPALANQKIKCSAGITMGRTLLLDGHVDFLRFLQCPPIECRCVCALFNLICKKICAKFIGGLVVKSNDTPFPLCIRL